MEYITDKLSLEEKSRGQVQFATLLFGEGERKGIQTIAVWCMKLYPCVLDCSFLISLGGYRAYSVLLLKYAHGTFCTHDYQCIEKHLGIFSWRARSIRKRLVLSC